MSSTTRTELINRYKLFPVFLENGFVPFEPVFDSGIEFILFREADGTLLKVQQKAVWTVDTKYFGKGMWILFGDHYDHSRNDWYLMPHDLKVEADVRDHGHTASMRVKSGWNNTMSRERCSEFSSYQLPSVFNILADTNKKISSPDFKVDWPRS
jgi:hypothetical protein